jgi:hypothetical protein
MGRLYPIGDDEDEEVEKQASPSREHSVLVYTDHV